MGAVGADTKEYENEMKKKVAKKKNMLWINKLLKEEEYIQLYSNAKVFICPSIYEPFGIINLEAMACETPVVASAVGGILEVVIPNETGILIEPANPKAIANAINELLKDEKKCKEMGKRGRERVEKFFSWSYIAHQTKNLYEKLLSS
jgi:glycosyltransferase involved in cell wall biosynthesis